MRNPFQQAFRVAHIALERAVGRFEPELVEHHADHLAGARPAITFLKHDPPLFFRQKVIGKLDSVFHKSFGLEAGQPFTAHRNAGAGAMLRQAAGID